jgi:hypothetical protein
MFAHLLKVKLVSKGITQILLLVMTSCDHGKHANILTFDHKSNTGTPYKK